MAFELDNIVPWGRTFEEYCLMFSLTDKHAVSTILGCGDGPASFNKTATERGWNVVSVDPIYEFTKEAIKHRIDQVKDDVIRQTRLHRDQFLWNFFPDPDALFRTRMGAMQQFLEDFDAGSIQQRYRKGALPNLPFKEKTFDLALVSHLLFLYSEHMDLTFHIQAIEELLRVADEVRIFPLLDLHVKTSIHLPPVIKYFSDAFDVHLEQVNYEFQKGGNQMMVIQNR